MVHTEPRTAHLKISLEYESCDAHVTDNALKMKKRNQKITA